MIYVNLYMMVGIKTEERLLGKRLLFISYDLQGRGWLLSTSPHLLTNSRPEWTPAKCSEQLLEEGQSRRKKKREVNISSALARCPTPLWRCQSRSGLQPLHDHLCRVGPQAWKQHTALAMWRLFKARPGMSQRDIPSVTEALLKDSVPRQQAHRLLSGSNHPYGCLEED